MIFLLSSIDIVKPFDNIYKIDLSGDNQIVYVSGNLKPLRVQVFEEGKILQNYEIKVFLITPSNILTYKIKTDSLGYAIFIPPKPQIEGIYRVIFYNEENFTHFKYIVINKFFILFSILEMIGGFVIFLYGMEKLNRGINAFAGVTIRDILKKFPENRVFSFLIGIILTLAIQSSTAINVMLVSFVDSGLLSLKSALSIALGAGIGSTFTTQLISFGIFELSLLLVAIGYILKRMEGRIRAYGNAIFGIGLLFFSIKLMSKSASSLSIFPEFENFFRLVSDNAFFGIFISTIFTALVHSSAAVVGFAISLAFENVIDLKGGIYIVLGANIGTTITAILASLKSGVSGRRIAFANFFYKFITFLIILIFLNEFINLVEKTDSLLTRQIANAHTLFNIIGALLFLPFLDIAQIIFNKLFKESIKEKILPDPSVFDNSSIAIAVVHRRIIEMSGIIENMLNKIPEILISRNPSIINETEMLDNEVDKMREEIILYLIKLQKIELSEEEGKKASIIANIVDEFEAIGDVISKSITRNMYKLYSEGLKFSKEGLEDLLEFHKEVMITFQIMNLALLDFDKNKAKEGFERRTIVNSLLDNYHQKHFSRLKALVQEAILTSSIHVEILNNLERINYHISEICKEIMS
ncbi:MAG: Na/Pi cotransporter family protein [candidate division WOR-3 bacterium]